MVSQVCIITRNGRTGVKPGEMYKYKTCANSMSGSRGGGGGGAGGPDPH